MTNQLQRAHSQISNNKAKERNPFPNMNKITM